MAKASSQKFIGRNRPPRVQIEYDVELYGAEKAVQIPFVMGVMADLTGKRDPENPLPNIEKRQFKELDIDNFGAMLKSINPTVSFRVPDVLTGKEGESLNVNISFESMDDFSPAAVAKKVAGVSKLYQAREQLANLLAWMDGKADAESLIAKALQDTALLQALTAAAKTDEQSDQVAEEEGK